MNRRTPRPEDAAPGGPPPVSVLYVNDNVPLRNQIEELNSELLLLTTATAPPTEQKTTPTDTAQRTTTYKTSAVITRPDTHFTCPNKRQKKVKNADIRSISSKKRIPANKVLRDRPNINWERSAVTGNPLHPDAVIEVKWQIYKGASLIAKQQLFKGDIVSRYDVALNLSETEFLARYPRPWTALPPDLKLETEYIVGHKNRYLVGRPFPYANTNGVAQFTNSASSNLNERNNSAITITRGGDRVYVRATVNISANEEILTSYNRGTVIPEYQTRLPRPCPSSLRLHIHTVVDLPLPPTDSAALQPLEDPLLSSAMASATHETTESHNATVHSCPTSQQTATPNVAPLEQPSTDKEHATNTPAPISHTTPYSSSPLPVWENVRQKAAALQLTLVRVPADGNCFLHASRLALLQLGGYPDTLSAADIRRQVSQWMLDEEHSYVTSHTFTLGEIFQQVRDPADPDKWETYVETMSTPGKDVDIPFLLAFSKIYNVRVRVINAAMHEHEVYTHSWEGAPMITLGYSAIANHYVATTPLGHSSLTASSPAQTQTITNAAHREASPDLLSLLPEDLSPSDLDDSHTHPDFDWNSPLRHNPQARDPDDTNTVPPQQPRLTKLERLLADTDTDNQLIGRTNPGHIDITIGTLNINVLTEMKLATVIRFMQRRRIHVIALQDTRVKPDQTHFFSTQARSLLGPGAYVATHPVHADAKVGGQMILVLPEWGGAVVESRHDRSDLAVLTWTTIRAAQTTIQIQSTYWPIPHQHNTFPDSLEANLQRFISKSNDRTTRTLSPLQWIKDQIELNQYKHHKTHPDNASVLLGDFNASWTPQERAGSHKPIMPWAILNNWSNDCREILQDMYLPTHFRGLTPTSTIDHILTCGSHITALGQLSTLTPIMAGVSDHRVVWVPITVVGGRGQQGLVHGPPPNRLKLHKNDLDRTDKEERANFQAALTEQLDIAALLSQSPEAILFQVAHQSVLATQNVQQKTPCNSSKVKDGWSPQAIAHKAHYTALMEMYHQSRGIGRQQWTPSTFGARLNAITKTWKKQVANLKPPDGIWPTLDVTGIGPTHLATMTFDELWRALPDQIRRILKLMHGKERTENRLRINAAVTARELSVQQGRIGKAIRSMVGKYNMFYDVDALTLDDGSITTDPIRIHRILSAAFEDHFDCPPAHRHSPLQSPDTDPWRFITDRTYFDSCNAQHHIPPDVLDTIWSGTQAVPNANALRQDMEDIFLAPVTFDEFQNIIQLASNNTAPGPSGLSFNMIKSWPDDVIQTVFSALNTLWNTKDIPSQWKWRWLCLKPKIDAGVPTASELRPLSLVDCIRKLWEKLLLRRIQCVWSTHGVPAENQHCRSRRGCSTALLEFQAVQETAEETSTNVFFSSWDIRRAFDSISKTVIMMSWMRLGVPAAMAEYLVKIDDDSHTLIRTPAAYEAWRDLLISALPPGTPPPALPLPIRPKRGCGQGTVLSPSTWIAFFDMLLCSLAAATSDDDLILPSSPSQLHSAKDPCYMDDLLTLAHSQATLQQKADIVSAFCIIFGVDIAVTKLRSYVCQWSPQPLPDNLSIIIHTGKWTPHAVPLQLSTAALPLDVKYLGIPYTLDNSSATLLKMLSTDIQRTCHTIAKRKASAKLKALAYNSYGLARLRYYGPHLTASLADTQAALDTPVQQLLRNTSQNMRSFPSALLFIPRNMGGLGFKKPSDVIHSTKLQYVDRAYIQSTQTLRTVSGLLLRPQRLQQQQPYLHEPVSLQCPMDDTPRCWALSLLQSMQAVNLTLQIQARPLDPALPLEHLLTAHMPATTPPEDTATLRDTNLYNIEDLDSGRRGLEVLSYQCPDLQFLTNNITTPEAYTSPLAITLRPGIALADTAPTVHIYQFLGILDDPIRLCMKQWSLRNNKLTANTDALRGAGSTFQIRPDELPPQPTRAILRQSSNTRATLIHTHASPPLAIPHGGRIPTPEWILRVLQSLPALPEYSIFTDGSYSVAASVEDIFRSEFGAQLLQRTYATAAIVIGPIDNTWRTSNKLTTVHITGGNKIGATSAFPMELLAIIASLQLATFTQSPVTEIVTDSLASCHRVRRMQNDIHATPKYTSLTQPLAVFASRFPGTVRWTKAHPERRNSMSMNWSRDDCLNHIADKTADNSIDYAFSDDMGPASYPPISIMVTASEVLDGLQRPGMWRLTSTDGSTPLLTGLQDAFNEHRLRKYTADRDEYRASSAVPRPPKWQHSTPIFAAQIFAQPNATLSTASLNVKLIWDKHWHGGNQTKHIEDAVARDMESACPLCDLPDSQDHWLRHCQIDGIRYVRDNYDRAQTRAIEAEEAKKHFDSATIMSIAQRLVKEHPDGASAWVGQWTQDIRASLIEELHRRRPALRILNDRKLRNLQQGILTLSRILAESATEIWKERRDLQQQKDGVPQHLIDTPASPALLPLSQSPVTSFFSRSPGTRPNPRPPRPRSHPTPPPVLAQQSITSHLPPNRPQPIPTRRRITSQGPTTPPRLTQSLLNWSSQEPNTPRVTSSPLRPTAPSSSRSLSNTPSSTCTHRTLSTVSSSSSSSSSCCCCK